MNVVSSTRKPSAIE
jgi:hypothetical protein